MQLPFTADSVQGVLSKQLTAAMPDPRLCDPDFPIDLFDFMRKSTFKSKEERSVGGAQAADALRTMADTVATAPVEMSNLSLVYLPSRRVQVH